MPTSIANRLLPLVKQPIPASSINSRETLSLSINLVEVNALLAMDVSVEELGNTDTSHTDRTRASIIALMDCTSSIACPL